MIVTILFCIAGLAVIVAAALKANEDDLKLMNNRRPNMNFRKPKEEK